jgi:hypothetical protein
MERTEMSGERVFYVIDRITKRSPLALPDHAAQAVYHGRLMLGENGLVYDTQTNDWHLPWEWRP